MDITIDEKELQKQIQEDIVKSGHYAEIRILLGENSNTPSTQVNIHKVSIQTIAKTITTLEAVVKVLKEDYPGADILSKFMGAETIGRTEI